MKRFTFVGLLLLLSYSSVFALSVESNTLSSRDISFDFVSRDKKYEVSHSQKCSSESSDNPASVEKSIKCSYEYRSQKNTLSVSKSQACKKKDGLYQEMLAFDWKFSGYDIGSNDITETENRGFIVLKGKLYYIVYDHLVGTDAPQNYYVYSYDCNAKKIKQHYASRFDMLSRTPLWVDHSSSMLYVLKNGASMRLSYKPYTIIQINLKNNKVKEYQLFDEKNDLGYDELIEFVPSTFARKTNLMSHLVDRIYARGVDSFKQYYPDGSDRELSIGEYVNIRRYGTIQLSKVRNGVGVLTIKMPGYTVTADIDFNAKTIK